MQRACAAALLKGGSTTICNYGISNDDKAALDVVQQFGATVHYGSNFITIKSDFNNVGYNLKGFLNEKINLELGESGLGLRMFTPIAALLQNEVTINGHGSLTMRPMHFFDDILPKLNVDFKSNKGFLPFIVKGKLQPNDIIVDGSLSSQFLTGLLMAYSYTNENAIITVNKLTSKPYIDITLDVLKSFGLNVPENKNYEQFVFTKKEDLPKENFNYTIESDWSSTSFLLVAAAINGDCTFTGLNMESVQADKKIMEALQKANAQVIIVDNEIKIQKSNLISFDFDATECPDLFPPLVALAANAVGITTISGLKRLAHKESNRGVTLQEEFAKLGVEIILEEDVMQIKGSGEISIKNKNCDSHNDHRIAMALTVAVLLADKEIEINNAEAINKSYPNFYNDIESLVGKVEKSKNI